MGTFYSVPLCESWRNQYSEQYHFHHHTSATGDVDFNDAWLAEVLAITGAPQALDGGAGGGELEDRQMSPGAQDAAAEGLPTAASATGGVDINDGLLAEVLGVGPAIDDLHMDGTAVCTTDDVNNQTHRRGGRSAGRPTEGTGARVVRRVCCSTTSATARLTREGGRVRTILTRARRRGNGERRGEQGAEKGGNRRNNGE